MKCRHHCAQGYDLVDTPQYEIPNQSRILIFARRKPLSPIWNDLTTRRFAPRSVTDEHVPKLEREIARRKSMRPSHHDAKNPVNMFGHALTQEHTLGFEQHSHSYVPRYNGLDGHGSSDENPHGQEFLPH